MTEFRFERKKENVEDYIKTTMFGKTPAYKILIAALYIGLIAAAVSGLIMCFAMNRPEMITITIFAVIIGVAYPLFLHFFIKYLTKKLTAENPDEKDVTVAVSENEILLLRNGRICGRIEWTDITEITEGKTGWFLTEKQGAAIILGEGSVSSGTYDEAVQILNIKKAALK